MKRGIVSLLIIAFALGCPMYIHAESTNANDGGAAERSSSSSQMVFSSYYRAAATVTLADGTKVPLYTNMVGDDNAGNSVRLFYAPIPYIIVDEEDFFDQKSNMVHFKFGLRDCKSELPQLIQGMAYKDSALVLLPVRSLMLRFTTGNEDDSETIAIYEDACLSYNVDSPIHINHKVSNEQLIDLLKNHPNWVNVQVTLTTEFKEDDAAMAKSAFQTNVILRVREAVFGSRQDAAHKNRVTYMPINQFKDLVRDIESRERIEATQKTTVTYLGETADQAEKAIENFLKQNKDAFKTVSLDDVCKANGSITTIDSNFIKTELKPEEIDNMVNSHQQASKVHKFVEDNFDELKNLATESANEDEFYKKCSSSKSLSASGGYGPFSANVSGSVSESEENASRNANLSKFFSLVKQGKSNKEDFLQEFSDNVAGDLHQILSKPKEFTLMRISDSSFDRLNSFVFLRVTSSWSKNQKLNVLLSLDSQKEKRLVNAKIDALEAKVSQQSAQIEKLNEERDSLKATVYQKDKLIESKEETIKILLKGN